MRTWACRPHRLACVARIIETVLQMQEPVVAAHVERQSTDLRHQRRSELPYELAHGAEGLESTGVKQHATTYSTVTERAIRRLRRA